MVRRNSSGPKLHKFRNDLLLNSMHIKNIYDEGELTPDATIQDFLTIRREVDRDVQRGGKNG